MINKLVFLLEGTGEQIRKYYTKIPEDIYNKILMSDPTSIIKDNEVKKVGKYSKHCLNLYLKKSYDPFNLKRALDQWETNKKLIPIQFTKVKSVDEIFTISEKYSFKKEAEKGSKIVITSGNIIVRQILDKSAAIFYGNFNGKAAGDKYYTKWCVANPTGSIYDKKYTKKHGELYYIYKTNGELLYAVFYRKIASGGLPDIEIRNHDDKNSPMIKDKKIEDYFSKKYKQDIKLKQYIFLNENYIIGENVDFEDGILSFGELDFSESNLTSLTQIPWHKEKWTCESLNLVQNNLTDLKGLENLQDLDSSQLEIAHNPIHNLKLIPNKWRLKADYIWYGEYVDIISKKNGITKINDLDYTNLEIKDLKTIPWKDIKWSCDKITLPDLDSPNLKGLENLVSCKELYISPGYKLLPNMKNMNVIF